MNAFFIIAIAAFACFRAAELIVKDDGPFDCFLKFRTLMGVYTLGADGRPASVLGKLFSCPYCVGVWLALGCAIGLAPFDWQFPLYWFAIAGGQAFLQTIGGR